MSLLDKPPIRWPKCATHTGEKSFSQNLHMMLRHTIGMKKSAIAKGLTPIALIFNLLSATSPAVADQTPAPTVETYKSAIEQYKLDKEIYMAAMRARSQQIKAINLAFKNACDKAAQDFKSAMSVARTPDQKNFANATRKNAISAAILARDLAITNLGELPEPPVEPQKPAKVSSKNRSR